MSAVNVQSGLPKMFWPKMAQATEKSRYKSQKSFPDGCERVMGSFPFREV